jgi:hydrogenase maturation protein HypF
VARRILIRENVQDPGFRPWVFRLAAALGLHGWVLNGADGVRVQVEGAEDRVDAFVDALVTGTCPSATILGVDVAAAGLTGCP